MLFVLVKFGIVQYLGSLNLLNKYFFNNFWVIKRLFQMIHVTWHKGARLASSLFVLNLAGHATVSLDFIVSMKICQIGIFPNQKVNYQFHTIKYWKDIVQMKRADVERIVKISVWESWFDFYISYGTHEVD